MKLTIIVSDKTVYKDGVPEPKLVLQGIPSNVRVLQWQDSSGWLEFNDGTPNLVIDSLPDWTNSALDAWTAANTDTEPTPDQVQIENYEMAKSLLTSSDFTQLPDINISNKAEWESYRTILRAVATNPPTTPFDFPAKPALNWI